MKILFALGLIVFVLLVSPLAWAVDHSGYSEHSSHINSAASHERQAEVSDRGKVVMPFDLAATTHVFTKTSSGGTQKIVAKNLNDGAQIKLVRQHLQEIRTKFLQADFSGPSYIHGQTMPGLAELKAAKSGAIAIDYKNISGGGELTYTTKDRALVSALHKWFDAQVSDHGQDAMAGHDH